MKRTIETVRMQSALRDKKWRNKKENNTIVECFICNKKLKNIFTFKSHEKSKRHLSKILNQK